MSDGFWRRSHSQAFGKDWREDFLLHVVDNGGELLLFADVRNANSPLSLRWLNGDPEVGRITSGVGNHRDVNLKIVTTTSADAKTQTRVSAKLAFPSTFEKSPI